MQIANGLFETSSCANKLFGFLAFSAVRNSKVKTTDHTTVKTFFQLINLEPPVESNIKVILSIWGSSFMTNRQREFSFRCYNNTLGLNNRLAHVVQNINPGCAFCLANNAVNVQPESFSNLFFGFCGK